MVAASGQVGLGVAAGHRRAAVPGRQSVAAPAGGQLPAAGWGLYAGQLLRRLRSRAICRSAVEFAHPGDFCRESVPRLRRTAGVGAFPHRHARQRPYLGSHPGHVHHSALSGGRWLDSAGRSQCRMAEPTGGRTYRHGKGTVQHLLHARADICHRLLQFSLRIRVHQVSARSRLLGNGGCSEHSRSRQLAHVLVHHAAAGAASDSGGLHPGVPGSHCAVRFPRIAGTARPVPCGDDPAMAVLRVSASGWCRCGLCDAAAGHHSVAVLAAEAHHQSQGLRRSDWEGWRTSVDTTGPLEVADVRLLSRRLHAVFFHADGRYLPGCVG